MNVHKSTKKKNKGMYHMGVVDCESPSLGVKFSVAPLGLEATSGSKTFNQKLILRQLFTVIDNAVVTPSIKDTGGFFKKVFLILNFKTCALIFKKNDNI